MEGFPEFMKRAANRVPASAQNTKGVEGYCYEAADGSQMAFWTCREAKESLRHVHEFDEYMVCVQGEYTVFMHGQAHVLRPGDELLIPGGTEQWGRCTAGTRTIHAFGGRRIAGAKHMQQRPD